MDDDRIEEDRRNQRDPLSALAGENLIVVRLVPNLEGLLLRLHPNMEQHDPPASDALRQLKRVWPEYTKKSLNAKNLESRFGDEDLKRVARHDVNIRNLIEVLGI